MTLARRLATGDTYAVFVTSRMRTETRASSASVYVSSVVIHLAPSPWLGPHNRKLRPGRKNPRKKIPAKKPAILVKNPRPATKPATREKNPRPATISLSQHYDIKLQVNVRHEKLMKKLFNRKKYETMLKVNCTNLCFCCRNKFQSVFLLRNSLLERKIVVI